MFLCYAFSSLGIHFASVVDKPAAMFVPLVVLATLAAAHAQTAPDVETVLASMPQFSLFLQLLRDEGILQQLKGEPLLTLFVPTNDAIGKIDQALLAEVQNDPQLLQSYLMYHAVTSTAWHTNANSNDLVLPAATRQPVRINVYSDLHSIAAEGINITQRDIPVANGYVQGIDGVMEPPAGDVVDLINAWNTTATLAKLLATSGLDAVLKADKNLTIFAPNDDAFKKLDPSVLAYLQNNPSVLKEVLLYHVVADTSLYSLGMRHATTFKTADSRHDPLMLLEVGNDIFLNSAELADRDLSATNGVMHTVDQVLIPARVLIQMEDAGLGHVVG